MKKNVEIELRREIVDFATKNYNLFKAQGGLIESLIERTKILKDAINLLTILLAINSLAFICIFIKLFILK
jgi:hypothetical protein